MILLLARLRIRSMRRNSPLSLRDELTELQPPGFSLLQTGAAPARRSDLRLRSVHRLDS